MLSPGCAKANKEYQMALIQAIVVEKYKHLSLMPMCYKDQLLSYCRLTNQ